MLRRIIYQHGLVTDGWGSLDPADPGVIQKKDIRKNEERLMFAVLESAVEDFQKYFLARNPSTKKLFQETEEWLLEKESDELFSFENICETLQLHPKYILQGLMAWKEAKLKTQFLEGHHQDRTKLASTRIRYHPVRFSKVA
jgi:hypothetical protein